MNAHCENINWYIRNENNEEEGPFSHLLMIEQLRYKRITPHTLVKNSVISDWLCLKETPLIEEDVTRYEQSQTHINAKPDNFVNYLSTKIKVNEKIFNIESELSDREIQVCTRSHLFFLNFLFFVACFIFGTSIFLSRIDTATLLYTSLVTFTPMLVLRLVLSRHLKSSLIEKLFIKHKQDINDFSEKIKQPAKSNTNPSSLLRNPIHSYKNHRNDITTKTTQSAKKIETDASLFSPSRKDLSLNPHCFYLLHTQLEGEMLTKFGITNNISRRLKQHNSTNMSFKVYKLAWMKNESDARKLESALRERVRKKKYRRLGHEFIFTTPSQVENELIQVFQRLSSRKAII